MARAGNWLRYVDQSGVVIAVRATFS